MAETGVTPAETKKQEARPAPPDHLRDELLLKFVGSATLILGVVLLISSSIAIAVLSITKALIGDWLPILPLSLLLILVGGLVNGYFRRVIDRALNPKKYEAPPRPPPYGFVYPYQMPPPMYPMRMPGPPTGAPPAAIATGPSPNTRVPAPAAPAKPRVCITCGKRIPLESKFCPYCRH